MDMDYNAIDTCLEDSLIQPADPTQAGTDGESAPSCPTETKGDGADKPKSSGALAALVKVGPVPALINEYFNKD